jgi:hypothetical protein
VPLSPRLGVVVATHLLSWAVWRCGRAKALVERFLEITAPSRALSSLCRIARRMVRGPDQRALISGNINVTTPDGAPPTVTE